MLAWAVSLLLGTTASIAQYRWGGASKFRYLQAIRAIALVIIAALFLNARVGWSRTAAPHAVLDVSSSWLASNDTALWRRALAAVDSVGGDSLLLLGDSVRAGEVPESPTDGASRAAPLVERALGTGRAVVVVTDGRLDDSERLEELPGGSSIVLVDAAPKRDAGLAALNGPAGVVTGDSADYAAVIAAGGAGAGGGTAVLSLDGAVVASTSFDSIAPYTEREIRWRVSAGSVAGPRLVQAAISSTGDGLARNDTLRAVLDVAEGASAVFISTAPDFDARYALDVLRGTLALPTRGYFRVAPGIWRVEGTLAAVSEDEIRRSATEASIVVIHGDSAVFGAPRLYAKGSLGLIVPPVARGDEYYTTTAPASPLMTALSALPWDSLPPVEVGDPPRDAEWTALAARRGRRLDERRVIAGMGTTTRTVVVPAAGMWRWKFRGGRTAEAYTAMWGSVFDWLAGETSDQRGPRPVAVSVRVGEPVLWRRGGAKDSSATVTIRRRGGAGAASTDTLRLDFANGAIAETAPLAPGVYQTRIGATEGLLAVNESREWVPRRPSVRSGSIGSGIPAGRAPGARTAWWLAALALAALCAEWILRRKIGLR
ncbi:MAG: hypothetical protein FJ202_07790 [Gemmatimonadetes bacterium]|nr:hypothetical protein [Gemmatimonadota bacterium]